MLLNTVYAIGCFYSRSPYLYQNPFYTPQKAVEYFISKALAATPPPEVRISLQRQFFCFLLQLSLSLCIGLGFHLYEIHCYLPSFTSLVVDRLRHKEESYLDDGGNVYKVCFYQR